MFSQSCSTIPGVGEAAATTDTASSARSASDTELVEQIRGGLVAAYEAVMRRYNQRLFRIARSILREDSEAMDVVQETWIKAWYELEKLNDTARLGGWLSRIASNEAMMRLRKLKRIRYASSAPDSRSESDADHRYFEMESITPQPMDALANQQLKVLLEEAIDQLPVDYRSVYVMRAIQQLDTRETANVLEISEDLVKTRYLRARRGLQKMFEAHLKQAQMEVFEFAGKRCDTVVETVMARLGC